METRKGLALKAFEHVAEYDDAIAQYFRSQYALNKSVLHLRYGMNPHQKPAHLSISGRDLPLTGLST